MIQASIGSKASKQKRVLRKVEVARERENEGKSYRGRKEAKGGGKCTIAALENRGKVHLWTKIVHLSLV